MAGLLTMTIQIRTSVTVQLILHASIGLVPSFDHLAKLFSLRLESFALLAPALLKIAAELGPSSLDAFDQRCRLFRRRAAGGHCHRLLLDFLLQSMHALLQRLDRIGHLSVLILQTAAESQCLLELGGQLFEPCREGFILGAQFDITFVALLGEVLMCQGGWG